MGVAMKVRATKLTAFLTGIWTVIVMSGLQQLNPAFNKSSVQVVDLAAMVLLLFPPVFIFVGGVFEARPTYLLSSEGLKAGGRKLVRMLFWWLGAAVAGLAYLLANHLAGTHP